MVPANVEHISLQTNKGKDYNNLNVQFCYRVPLLLSVMSSGAFVPLTMEGNVLVDGVLASCYAFLDHDMAHVGMKPLLWFPSIMDLLLGEDQSVHGYATILQHLGGMMSPDKVHM